MDGVKRQIFLKSQFCFNFCTGHDFGGHCIAFKKKKSEEERERERKDDEDDEDDEDDDMMI